VDNVVILGKYEARCKGSLENGGFLFSEKLFSDFKNIEIYPSHIALEIFPLMNEMEQQYWDCDRSSLNFLYDRLNNILV